jgi:hypothetical protein
MMLPVIKTIMMKEHGVQDTTSNKHLIDLGGIQQVQQMNEASPPLLQNSKQML